MPWKIQLFSLMLIRWVLIYPGESALSNQFDNRLRVVPHSVPHRSICFWFHRDSKASETRTREKITSREKRRHAACRLFSRGVIFTRARVSLALLSLREKWGTSRSLLWQPCPEWSSHQAPVVQTLDNGIHRLNHYPAGKYLEINCVIHWIGLSISSATGAWIGV